MKSYSNSYDIDNSLIRAAGDTHKWTIEEAQEKMEYYRKKLIEVGEKSPKATVYATYMRNLSRYIMGLYAMMTPDELNAIIEKHKQENLNEQVKTAIEDLKKEVEGDEYTEFEEVKDNDE